MLVSSCISLENIQQDAQTKKLIMWNDPLMLYCDFYILRLKRKEFIPCIIFINKKWIYCCCFTERGGICFLWYTWEASTFFIAGFQRTNPSWIWSVWQWTVFPPRSWLRRIQPVCLSLSIFAIWFTLKWVMETCSYSILFWFQMGGWTSLG